MTSLTEFTLFPQLPFELRAAVWERVPQPARIVGHLPCSNCWSKIRQSPAIRIKTQCDHEKHPDWRLRYIAQPRDLAIFPPLHTCRESRSVWLPRYYRPPRYIDLRSHDFTNPPITGYKLRFDVPFISYESDVFTVMGGWSQADITGQWEDAHSINYDPFLGLDRKRMKHVAFCEIADGFQKAIIYLGLQSLPNLRSLSLLAMGPDPSSYWYDLFKRIEMPVVDMQHVDCELRDIPHENLLRHPLFGPGRPPRRYTQFSPIVRPLNRYFAVFKAWLWHAQHWDTSELRNVAEDPWWQFLDYVLEDGKECPLSLTGCGIGGHTKDEMMQWVPHFNIDCKMLCEKAWAVKLDSISAFDTSGLSAFEAEERDGRDWLNALF